MLSKRAAVRPSVHPRRLPRTPCYSQDETLADRLLYLFQTITEVDAIGLLSPLPDQASMRMPDGTAVNNNNEPKMIQNRASAILARVESRRRHVSR